MFKPHILKHRIPELPIPAEIPEIDLHLVTTPPERCRRRSALFMVIAFHQTTDPSSLSRNADEGCGCAQLSSLQ